MNISLKTIGALFVALNLLTSAVWALSAPHNPAFLRQLANPKAYVTDRSFTESICGTNNMQQVADYDGSRGQPVEFVSIHEKHVAALAYGTPDNSKKYCTGTLISEDLFLTASHCIDGTALNDFAVFNYQKVRGSTELEKPEHLKIIEVVELALGDLDYAIIRIDGKPGLKYGFAHFNTADIQNGHLLTIIQHPSGKPKTVDVGHRSGTRTNVYMTYNDLDTEPGSSGSGVLDETGSLVAVHTNGGCFNGGGDNAGVMLTEIIKKSPTIQALVNSSN